jgi:dipeptidyl-peptidase-3
MLPSPDEGGITAYFSRNMTKVDLALVKEFCASIKLDLLNTRTFKKADGSFVVTVASIDESKKTHKFKDTDFHVAYGEFAPYLKECQYALAQAKKYAANDTQSKMLEEYVNHFQTGNIDTHKDSQRSWVKDKGPVVESNIGFIETYKDPENSRAYFEGWVAVVDKIKSQKF